MKPEVRDGFRARVRSARERGLTLTQAIAEAYAWLLKPSKRSRAKVLQP